MTPLEDPLFTLHEAADLLGVSYWTAQRYIKTGRLAASKPVPGGHWIVRRSAIEAFINSNTERETA